MTDIEAVYEALATPLDRLGPEAAPLFLAKLPLALAQALNDPARALALIDLAARPDPGHSV